MRHILRDIRVGAPDGGEVADELRKVDALESHRCRICSEEESERLLALAIEPL